jgi:hypothetical protein
MHCSCTTCQTGFDVTAKEQDALKAHDFPLPTLCPSCRFQQRLTTRNELTLYRRHCSQSQKEIISLYPKDSPFLVFDHRVWWGDTWNGDAYGRAFDFDRPFFDQWHNLHMQTPKIASYTQNCINSDYCNNANDNKDCYLCMSTVECENCEYTRRSYYNRSIFDCFDIFRSEICYESITLDNCYHCFWCQNLQNSSDMFFCNNCIGCSRCIGCCNLRQKEYCVFNEFVGKEGYEQKLKEIQKNHTTLEQMRQQYDTFRKEQPARSAYILNATECSGDFIRNSKGCIGNFFVKDNEDCHHCFFGSNSVNCTNADFTDNSTLVINSTGMERCYNALCSYICVGSTDIGYCHLVVQSRNCFGCSSLKNKQYCILNKQYTQSEYENLLPKVITHMKKAGEWGQFFPPSISPFGYNQTVAQEYFPLTKEEILARNFQWKDIVDDIPQVEKIIPGEKLPDAITDIPDDVLNWAIRCPATKRPFVIQKQELDFYRAEKIPVPSLHPDERHRRRQNRRNPMRLFKRTCAICSKTMETTYDPKRPEKVLCEECYLKEVY